MQTGSELGTGCCSSYQLPAASFPLLASDPVFNQICASGSQGLSFDKVPLHWCIPVQDHPSAVAVAVDAIEPSAVLGLLADRRRPSKRTFNQESRF